jgi:hypothetical protein
LRALAQRAEKLQPGFTAWKNVSLPLVVPRLSAYNERYFVEHGFGVNGFRDMSIHTVV